MQEECCILPKLFTHKYSMLLLLLRNSDWIHGLELNVSFVCVCGCGLIAAATLQDRWSLRGYVVQLWSIRLERGFSLLPPPPQLLRTRRARNRYRLECVNMYPPRRVLKSCFYKRCITQVGFGRLLFQHVESIQVKGRRKAVPELILLERILVKTFPFSRMWHTFWANTLNEHCVRSTCRSEF